MEERWLRVSENKVLRGIYGAKRDGVTGQRRKLHNEELSDLYCSPNIVRVIKSRRLRWAGLVEGTEVRLDALGVLGGGDLRERNHFEDPGVDGRIILRWIFRKWDVGVWTGSSWLRKGTSGGHL